MESYKHAADTWSIIPCPPEKRREALLQLAAAHDPAQQAALSAGVKAMQHQPDAQWGGLWISLEGQQLTGAIWVQPLPLNMAQLWLPNVQGDHRNALIETARNWVMEQQLTLCHIEIPPMPLAPRRSYSPMEWSLSCRCAV